MDELIQPDFEQLLARHLDGELSPEEGMRFADLLRQDPANARAFARASVMHQHVRVALKFDHAVGAPIQPEEAGSVLRWSWLSGSVLFGLAALVLAAALWWRSDSRGPEVAQASPEAPPIEVPSVHILSGTTKLMLPKIGHVVVEGPAEFDMLGPMRARLTEGRVRVRVTEKTGHGFVVETPHGKVTDLGTEFGLSVPREGKIGLVVFDGEVDLEVNDVEGGMSDANRVSRLVRGDGVTFDDSGQVDRIHSIVSDPLGTFRPLSDGDGSQGSLIASVHDDLRTDDTKKFYEIVPGGFGEDVLAYVDRPHEWNGVDSEGLPKYLMGADYIKTFSDDKVRTNTKIYVAISRPAKLYVIYDRQLKPPKWLTKDFRKLKGKVGMDLDNWPTIGRLVDRGVDAGKSIDHEFDIWEREVKEPGVVALGANGRLGLNGKPSKAPYMYGIAAVPLDAEESSGAGESELGRDQESKRN